MNKIFRIIWNRARGQLVVVSELGQSKTSVGSQAPGGKLATFAPRIGAIGLGLMLALAGMPAARAHTISIGYENSGNNALTFWYGTYHSSSETTYNEGSLRLVGPGIDSTLPFNLLTSTRPAGLLDGGTNFYNDGGVLGPTNEFGQNVVNWQGLQFTNLVAGTYTFTYVPIANPTQVWAPEGPVILSNSVTVITADLSTAPRVGPGQVVDQTNAGDPLLLDGGTLRPTDDATMGQVVSIADNGGTIDTDGHDLTLTGDIDGRGVLTKDGDGTLSITGDNTSVGDIDIQGGTLNVQGDGNLGTGDLTIGSGTFQAGGSFATDNDITLTDANSTIDTQANDLTLDGTIDGSGTLNKDGSGTLVLGDTNTYTGGTVINDGTLALSGGGSIADSSGVTNNGVFDISGANGDAAVTTLDGSGTVALGGNDLDLTGATGTFDGTIDGTGGLNILGGSETLTGDNGYTGATTIAGGATLALTDDGSIASSSDVTSNGTFDISGANGDIDITTLDGNGTVALGGNDLNLTDAAGTFGGSIHGTGGLNVQAGTETLTGDNGYTGATTIDQGATVALAGGGSIADSAGVTNNGVFDISGANGDAAVTTLDGNGTVALGGNDLDLTDASGIFDGAIDGAGGLNVHAGTETLTGDNGYTGATTIAGGATLALTGDGSISNSADVTSNGTFDISRANGDADIRTLDGTGTVALGDNDLNLTHASSIFDGSIEGTGGLHVQSGVEVLTGDNGYTGTTTIDAGAVLALSGDGSIAASAGVTDNGIFAIDGANDDTSIATLDGNGVVALGGNDLILTNASGTFDGGINGTGGVKIAGGTQVLIGNNTYAGGTTIDHATLQVGSDANLGNASGDLVFNDGTLRTTGDVISSRDIVLAGEGTLSTGAGTSMTDTGDVSGSGTLVKDGAGSLELSGTLSHTGGTVVNDGTLVLGGTNTYTGGTTLNGGTLQISRDVNLGDASSGLTFDGGTLHATGSLSTVRTTILTDDGRFDIDTGAVVTGNGTVAGQGALVKQGDGTLVLTGANSYTGGTVIDAGTLRGNSSSLRGDIVDNGTLDFTQATNGTLGGAISGTGVLLKNGSGTLTLNGTASHLGGTIVNAGTLALGGTNTYTGGTTVNGGTLMVSRDANLGDASSDLTLAGGTLRTTGSFASDRDITVGGGSFTTDAGTTFTSGGAIGGTGGLVKNGQGAMVVDGVAAQQGGTTVNAGTLILNGNNTYTGGTTLNGGSLQIANDANLGNLTNDVTFNGGDLTVTQSIASDRDMVIQAGNASITTLAGVTFSAHGDMSGTGGLVKRGGGTLVVSGNNTFTGGTLIDGGVIKIDSGSSLGTGTILLHGGTLQTVQTLGTGQTVLVSGDSGVNVDAGKIAELSGQVLTDGNAGCFVKSGKGTLNMTGTAMLSNGTCVQEGMLRANGELTSQVQVDRPGTLRGTGHISGSVNVEGTLAAGNSPGTLVVAGAVTMHKGSTLQVDIDGHGTGTGKGNYSRLLVGGQFTAAGTLAPTLRGITGNASNAFVPAVGDVYTVVQAAGGVSGKFDALQQPTAGLADNTRFQVFYVGGQAVELFVTPASYATLVSDQANGNAVRAGDAVDRIVAAQDVGAETDDQHGLLFALAGLRAVALPQVMQDLAGEAHAQTAAMAREASFGLAGDMADHLAESSLDQGDHGSRSWATLSQGGYRALSDAQATGFHSQQSRASAGLDAYRGDLATVGVGLAHTEARLENTPASGNVRGNGVMLYGELAAGKALLDGTASWSRDTWSTRRADPLAPAASLSSEADGHSMAASVTARFPLQHEGMRIEPYVQALWQRVDRDGFAETGDALTALSVGRYDQTGTRLLAGLKLGSAAQDPLATSATWRVGAAVGQDFGDTLNPAVDATLGGESFSVRAPSMGKTLLKLDASGTLRVGKQSYLYGGLTSATGHDRASYGVNVGVRVQF